MSGISPFLIDIKSVRLQTSHVRITRDATQDDPPFRTQSLMLWANDGTASSANNPATIPLTGAMLIVTVTSLSTSAFDFILSGTGQIGASARTPYPLGLPWVDVFVPITASAVPWALGGTIAWTYNPFAGPQSSYATTPTPVQLYAVSSDMAPMYKTSGIPQKMLDFFVGQIPPAASSSIAQWIEWVITRCHASNRDPETKARSPIHNYCYNTYTGAPRFAYMEQFDLQSWLSLCNTQSDLITINCYDQAAIAICALNLGLPYNLVGTDGQVVTSQTVGGPKGNPVPTVQRYFKGVFTLGPNPGRFGYIKTADLVGWGGCNSPFFGTDPNNIIVKDAPDSTGFAKRSSFANHYFVCYNTLDSQGNVVHNALDACAGPVATPLSITDYAIHVIDGPASTKYNGTGWNQTTGFYPHTPTDTINILSLFKSKLPSVAALEEPTGPSRIWAFLNAAVRQNATSPIAASITALFQSISEAAQITTTNLSTDIGQQRSSISTEFSQSGSSFATGTIDIMQNPLSAKLQAYKRIDAMQRDVELVFALPNDTQYLGDLNLVANSNSNLNAALIVYNNIVFFLEGDDSPPTQFNALVKGIDAYMTSVKATAFTPFDASSVTVSMQSSVSVGVPFDINITAPGVVDMAVESQSEVVQVTKGPIETPTGYILTCTTYQTGNDSLAFGFAQTGTYFPSTSIVMPIAVTTSPQLLSNANFLNDTDPWEVDSHGAGLMIQQPGLAGSTSKFVVYINFILDSLGSASLRQRVPTLEGQTYKLSVQYAFVENWTNYCFNVYANKYPVYSKQSGSTDVVTDSSTFIATDVSTEVHVRLQGTAGHNMRFEIGYVKLELLP